MINPTGFFATGTHPLVTDILAVDIVFHIGMEDDYLRASVNGVPIDSVSVGWNTSAIEDVHPSVLILTVQHSDPNDIVAWHINQTRAEIAAERLNEQAVIDRMLDMEYYSQRMDESYNSTYARVLLDDWLWTQHR